MNDASTPLNVVFIGLGMMGRGMARHVLARGYSAGLLVRSEEGAGRCADLLAAGARSLATSAEVAAMADVLIICVTGSPEVEDVVLGQHGCADAAQRTRQQHRPSLLMGEQIPIAAVVHREVGGIERGNK